MNYRELDLYASQIDANGFELEYNHPQLKSVFFKGSFESLFVKVDHDHGSWEQPSSDDVEINFEIDMDSLEVYDEEGGEVEGIGKAVIELIEQEITDYINENLSDFE